MKISNFRDYQVQSGDKLKAKVFATVDVETGRWRKRTETVQIFKDYLGYSWRFLNGGAHTPSWQCEELEAAYHAQMALKKIGG